MSLQYLVGGSVDYTEGLEGSRSLQPTRMRKVPAGVAPSAFDCRSLCRMATRKPLHPAYNIFCRPDKRSHRAKQYQRPFSSSANVGNTSMPANGRQSNEQRDDHTIMLALSSGTEKRIKRGGVNNPADNTGRGIDFGA